ncbi:MAG: hypothetical protein ACOZCO_11145 [Bacteroidota bacterium]
MKFPVYRKYPNNLSYFRIASPDEFEEIKITGSYYSLLFIKAKILPERNFIEDMIKNENGNWVEITGQEYDKKKQEIISSKKKLA